MRRTLSDTASAVRLAVAGLRYRGTRSAVVGVLAVLATAAAVLGPAYSRAAEQSTLLDHLRAAPSWLTGFSVSSTGVAGDNTPAAVAGARGPSPTSDALARIPVDYLTRNAARTMLADRYYGAPVGGVQSTVALPSIDGDVTTGRLVYRQGYCQRLRPVEGRCPQHTGEVLASTRSPYKVGARVVVTASAQIDPQVGDAGRTTVTVVGRYAVPRDTAGGYWFNHGYFDAAVFMKQNAEYRRIDSFFGSERTVHALGVAEYTTMADFPLRVESVRLDDVATLRAELSAGRRQVDAAGLSVSSPLTGVLSDVDSERDQVTVAALLVAVQLVLLCWFVLFGVVRGATDERGPELGLAKLRGLSGWRVAGFGLTEIGLLVLAATPVGVAVGLAGTQVVAWLGLAAGVHAELRLPVLVAAVAAFAGALVAAALAVRRTVTGPVIDLLRRVPVRAHRLRAGVTEGVLVAAALAACYELLTGAGGRLGLLAGGLVAVVAGVVAGRLLPLALRRAVRTAGRRGRVPALLAAARLSRRGQVPRTVALVTVAVALLCYGVVTWDVAGRNEAQRAGTALGAATVYSVGAETATDLRAAVRKADPSGTQAMAVARGLYGSGDGTSEILAVDSDRLARVGYWQSSFADVAPDTLARRLRPTAPAPVTVASGPLAVTVDVGSASPGLALVALLSDPHRQEQVVRLGRLTAGRHTLTGTVDCTGCRLVGFDLYRGPDTPAAIRGSYTLVSVRQRGADLVGFAGGWRAVESTLGQPVSAVSTSAKGAAVRFDSPGGEDLRVLYGDTPYPLPAVTTGRLATRHGTFRGPGLYGLDQAYRVVGSARTLPAIGTGVMVDLTYADRVASFGESLDTPLRFQVWAAPDAPASLRQRLTAAGLTVTGVDSIAARRDRLARQGPALALRLYLIAAVAALLLAAGTVLVTAYLTARPVLYEVAALRAAGVSPRLVRRAGWREYGLLLGVAVVAGALAGGVGAALAVPHLPQLASSGGPPPLWWPGPWWPLGAVAGSAVLLAAVTAALVGTLVRRGVPGRLRGPQ
ncbi:hypothetical protein [Actinocatenispora rupis]|uniref:FtsX-like permease family protein n=1 Tax=Actinocatenispora rupis TaxID=519421 RepID=A0A8J3J9V2_9ACTN|nr:hypothetical protein [Actinocatenispora rupis]GID14522.1 hypothetical protein Aru02nite_54110 [Actinocatenispora rupis]